MKIPKTVRYAINLLINNKNKDYSVKFYQDDKHLCPIAQTYNITVESSFSKLDFDDADTLIAKGWNGTYYNNFIRWFDSKKNVEKKIEYMSEVLNNINR